MLVSYSSMIKYNLGLILSSRHISIIHDYNKENSQQLGCKKQLRTDGCESFKINLCIS